MVTQSYQWFKPIGNKPNDTNGLGHFLTLTPITVKRADES